MVKASVHDLGTDVGPAKYFVCPDTNEENFTVIFEIFYFAS